MPQHETMRGRLAYEVSNAVGFGTDLIAVRRECGYALAIGVYPEFDPNAVTADIVAALREYRERPPADDTDEEEE